MHEQILKMIKLLKVKSCFYPEKWPGPKAWIPYLTMKISKRQNQVKLPMEAVQG
jgi:hypothetical protein